MQTGRNHSMGLHICLGKHSSWLCALCHTTFFSIAASKAESRRSSPLSIPPPCQSKRNNEERTTRRKQSTKPGLARDLALPRRAGEALRKQTAKCKEVAQAPRPPQLLQEVLSLLYLVRAPGFAGVSRSCSELKSADPDAWARA